ncbi:hypothetical protein BC941DRAFT_410072 [Chlamydoabsidia padenii]|nr:hypothetical protein BC941DRAFT_410072 [Chlamydoabsidia padenii]
MKIPTSHFFVATCRAAQVGLKDLGFPYLDPVDPVYCSLHKCLKKIVYFYACIITRYIGDLLKQNKNKNNKTIGRQR